MYSWCGPCRCDCDRRKPGSMSEPPSCGHSWGPISATSCERIMADGMMQVRVRRISFEAENINSYELVAVAGGDLVPFTAGSHIDLHLPNGMIRSYSLVNDQREANIHLNFDQEPSGRLLDLPAIVKDARKDAHLYCCGPVSMLEAFEAATADRPDDHVHVEYFKAKEKPAVVGGFEVKLARSNRTI